VVIGDDDDFEDASGDEASHAHFEASDNTGRPTFSLFQKPPASILSQYSYKKLSTDVMDTSEALRTARYELRKRAGLIYRHKEIVPANVPRQITEHDAPLEKMIPRGLLTAGVMTSQYIIDKQRSGLSDGWFQTHREALTCKDPYAKKPPKGVKEDVKSVQAEHERMLANLADEDTPEARSRMGPDKLYFETKTHMYLPKYYALQLWGNCIATDGPIAAGLKTDANGFIQYPNPKNSSDVRSNAFARLG